MNKLFSIITPNFNSGNLLCRVIENLFLNSVNFEHIIIDDNSTDNSFELAKDFVTQKKFNNVKFIKNNQNQGSGKTRNNGLVLATGRYLIFCDADDYLKPGTLDVLAANIAEYQYPEIIVFGYDIFNGKKITSVLPKRTGLINNQVIFLTDFLEDKIISAPWGKAIRSDLILKRKIIFPDLRMSEDAIFNLKIFSTAQTCLYLNTTLYYFDKSSDITLTRIKFTDKEALSYFRSWIFFEHCYRKLNLPACYSPSLEARRFRFCVLTFIVQIALSQSRPEYKMGKLTYNIIKRMACKREVWFSRKLTLKEKCFVLFFFIMPKLSLQLMRQRIGI